MRLVVSQKQDVSVCIVSQFYFICRIESLELSAENMEPRVYLFPLLLFQSFSELMTVGGHMRAFGSKLLRPVFGVLDLCSEFEHRGSLESF